MPERQTIAFYAPAPAYLARSMRRAVKQACTVADGKEIVRDDGPNRPKRSLDWLCDGSKMRFFHGVEVDGEKINDGYACIAESIDVKYSTPDMLRYADHCISVTQGDDRLEIKVHCYTKRCEAD